MQKITTLQQQISYDSCSNVRMGSYDGADVCELLGIYILPASINGKI